MVNFMNLRILIASVIVTLAACTHDLEVNEVVEGEPLNFPVRSVDAFARLESGMLVNCVSEDSLIESRCRERLQQRGTHCRGRSFVVTNSQEWSRLSRDFLECLTPNPICRGHEIRTEAEYKEKCLVPEAVRLDD